MAGPDEPIKTPDGQGANSLSSEQRDTAKLLKLLLGKTVSDRYIDFCRLSAGDFDLRVASPMAGHALRELDSILRATLAVPFEAKTEAALPKAKRAAAMKALKALGHEQAAINRALGALAPRENHREQIRKIVARLGLDPDGDIAKNWYRVMRAADKAHEREFNRELSVDDEFRSEWAKPFDTVVRGVAVALQGHYSVLAKRVELLASMDDAEKAVSLFEAEIPGAMSLQWLFFRRIEGSRWLPVLIKQGLIEPPRLIDDEDDGAGSRMKEWPVGAYLLAIAKTGNESDRALVAEAIRSVKMSDHPDLRRDGLEIVAAMPGKEAAALVDVVVEWLSDDNSLYFGGHYAEALLKKISESGEHEATFLLGKAMLRIYDRDGEVRSLYAHRMYEHSLPKTAKILSKAAGIATLRLLVDLLYKAAEIDGKIRTNPPADYTSVILAPLITDDSAYDIFGALVKAVDVVASELIQQQDAPFDELIAILSEHKERIFRRLLYSALSHNPKAAPDLADSMLLDTDAQDSITLRYEYGKLAKARFPNMSPEQQSALLQLADSCPDRREQGWRKLFEDHEKRAPGTSDVRIYRMAMVRDVVWEWRDVLPEDWKFRLQAIVAKIQDPDAWKRRFETGDESPMSADEFKSRTPEEVAEYLRHWQPDPKNTETKTALAFELHKAVQADPAKFAAGAMAFAGLQPIYVRRYFEGLRQPAQNKVSFDWAEPLKLIESVLPAVTSPPSGETSSAGDDPSWFWAALEGAELLRAGLQQGKEGIGAENSELVSRLGRSLEKLAPPLPEGDTFASYYKQTPFFAAQKTLLGLATEFRILEIFWLSKQEGSFAAKAPKEALKNSPDFVEFANRALARQGANGQIVHAIFGRYLDWLYYFGADWVEANIGLIFPEDKDLSQAAWLSHLINGGGPILKLIYLMRGVYAGENEHLLMPPEKNEREWRHERFGQYVLLQYLFGDYPKDLLDGFFKNAPPRLLQHTMWYLGRQLRRTDITGDVLKRGLNYWEMRLAAGEQAADKAPFTTELAGIGSWLHDTDLEPRWLIDQMRRMLRAGFAPAEAHDVVEYASKVVSQEPAEAVALIGDLFQHPKTDQWAYISQQPAVRKILEGGLATGHPQVKADVERVISYLAARGENSFLDLSAKAE
jgi:hypothetical protein